MRARARFIIRIVDRGLGCKRVQLNAAICDVEGKGGGVPVGRQQSEDGKL